MARLEPNFSSMMSVCALLIVLLWPAPHSSMLNSHNLAMILVEGFEFLFSLEDLFTNAINKRELFCLLYTP